MGWKLKLQCFVKTNLDSLTWKEKQAMQLNPLCINSNLMQDFFEYSLLAISSIRGYSPYS